MGQTRIYNFPTPLNVILHLHFVQNLSLWRTWKGAPTVRNIYLSLVHAEPCGLMIQSRNQSLNQNWSGSRSDL